MAKCGLCKHEIDPECPHAPKCQPLAPDEGRQWGPPVFVAPPGEEIRGMVVWRGDVWVATTGGVYTIEHDPLTGVRISKVDPSEGP